MLYFKANISVYQKYKLMNINKKLIRLYYIAASAGIVCAADKGGYVAIRRNK